VSFGLFVWFCTAWGAAGACAAWLLGQRLAGEDWLVGLVLGGVLGLVLGLVDSLSSHALGRFVTVSLRGLFGLAFGAAGGFLGGTLVLAAGSHTAWPALVGWPLLGLLVGAGSGAFDLAASALLGKDARGGLRKAANGLLGGFVGGLLGAAAFLGLKAVWADEAFDPREDPRWMPGVTEFAALGACIGLVIGLCQVLFKGAWLRVESGFGVGQQMILSKPETTIGRAPSCDLGLPADTSLQKVHARIVRRGADYLLAGAGPETFVNESPVCEPTALHPGDKIRVGRTTLQFFHKRKG
jgi:hypothetical protein